MAPVDLSHPEVHNVEKMNKKKLLYILRVSGKKLYINIQLPCCWSSPACEHLVKHYHAHLVLETFWKSLFSFGLWKNVWHTPEKYLLWTVNKELKRLFMQDTMHCLCASRLFENNREDESLTSVKLVTYIFHLMHLHVWTINITFSNICVECSQFFKSWI